MLSRLMFPVRLFALRRVWVIINTLSATLAFKKISFVKKSFRGEKRNSRD